jgi:hypothetical protein
MDNIDKYVKGYMLNDGSHKYAIPENLFKENENFIHDFDEDSVEDCDKWDRLFSEYRVDGHFEFYIKLKQ